MTTQLLQPDNGTYRDVRTWTLGYQFREPGDGTSPVLWLASITDTGKVGGTLAAQPVTFQGIQLDNRVDALEGLPAMTKWRITDVYDESGGHLHVNYALVDCARPTLPAVDTNTRRCFPQYWQTDGGSDLNLDWFHKYVPVQVLEGDVSGVAEVEETTYEYLDGGAWHYDDNDLTPEKYRTWGQWRGFGRVRVTHGSAGGVRTGTEVLFMRGMDGDRLLTGTRTAAVTDSTGATVTDSDPLAGFGRETITWSNVSGGQTEAVIADPWLSSPTAANGPAKAYMVEVSVERKRVALEGGGWRTTEKRSHFDSYGQLSQVDDLGDTSTAADDQCTRITYARNTSAWIVDTESRIETVGVSCSGTPSYPDDVVSDTRYYYDGSAVHGAAPTYGDATKEEELASFSGTTPVYAQKSRTVYDPHGREVEGYDELDAKTATTYIPAAGGPVSGQTVTNPAGHTVTTTFEPAWGEELVIVDPNGRRTEMTYDPLGRVTAVWLPNRPRASGFTPSERYTYLIRTDAPSVVTEETIRDNDTYEPTYVFYDGRLRERQTQAVAPDGGRVVTDTFYDSRGLVAKENLEYWNSGAAGTTMLTGVADSAVPGQNVYLYDASERETDDVFRSFGAEKWRTVTTYHGDRISIDPPAGQTPTTQVLDADERVVELRHYAGDSPTGGYDATKYTYTKAGHLESVTDAVGNVWRYEYDLRGRETRRTDPDNGATTSTYDDAGRLLSTTDAREVTLAFTYDVLGRKTGVFDGSPSGTPRAQWRYDTLSTGATVKGQPASATRYVNGNAYTESVDAYDAMYRPLVRTVTIPAAEGALSGAYRINTGYTHTGLPATVSYPAAGGLPAETLRYGYDGFGRLKTVQTGLSTLQVSAGYTPFGEPLSRTFSAAAGRQLTATSFYENGTRRLSRAVVDATPTGHLADVNYTYDASGNITRIADTPMDGTADVQCFKYDYLQRLSEAWSATDNCAAAPAASRIGGPAPYWQAWTYDKVGNRLSEANFNPATGARVTSAYAYPAARSARPHAVSSVTTGSRVDGYAYDASGNTISRSLAGVPQTLTWDAEGELATVTHNGRTSSYLYDADGQRLIRRDPDATTLYLMGTELRLAAGVVSATRLYPLGTVVGVRTAAGLAFQVADQHGTATISVNAADMSVSRRWYSPFGGPRGAAAGSWPDEHGYVGGVNDTAIGLVRLGAREYDPATGRFISVDPLIDVNDPQQMNGYAYASNTPIVANDADGEFLKNIVKKIRNAVKKIKRVVHRAVKKVVKKAKKVKRIKSVISRLKKIVKRAVKAVKKRFASAAKRAKQKALKQRAANTRTDSPATHRKKARSSGCAVSPYASPVGSALGCLADKVGKTISGAVKWGCRQLGVGSNAGGLGAGLLSMSKKGWLGRLARGAGWAGVAISATGLGCQVGAWIAG